MKITFTKQEFLEWANKCSRKLSLRDLLKQFIHEKTHELISRGEYDFNAHISNPSPFSAREQFLESIRKEVLQAKN